MKDVYVECPVLGNGLFAAKNGDGGCSGASGGLF